MKIFLAVISVFLLVDIKLYDACDNFSERKFGDYCYIAGPSLVDFKGAEHYCKTRKGKLVSILSEKEDNFVYALAQNLITEIDETKVYIGLTSLNETSWKYYWVDGSPFEYSNWKKGEPDSPDKRKCVFMDLYHKKWVSGNCITDKVPSVCKRLDPDAS